MASSDEEGEFLPDFVSNYEFIDGRDQHVSFSSIPLCMKGNDPDLGVGIGVNMRIYLQGTANGGLEQIYKQVLAWKYSLCSSPQPQIFVLCKGRQHWIQLLKPRKRFEFIITSTLVTLHFLHFVRNNPQAPPQCIWNHLSGIFSSYDVKPCERNILDHFELVKDAFKSDIRLSESEYVCELLGEQPQKRKLLLITKDQQYVKKPSFVVEEVEESDSLNLLDEEDPEEDVPDHDRLDLLKGKEKVKEAEEDIVERIKDDEEGQEEQEHSEMEIEDDEEMQLFDTCCSICDNGGDILCCEGPCMRSFHPTIPSGEPYCSSLGLSQAQVDAMPVFFCRNCKYKKHQCFVCGKLGSSDTSSGAEVFLCVSATCGRFYHVKCVAKTLYPDNAIQARKIEAQVAAGDTFTCPVHSCCVCGHGEDRNVHALQFAVCRRCPKAYHRKCLPRGISDSVVQRAWDDLLPNRILIYCLDHEIVPTLGTPARDHIIFSEKISMAKNKLATCKLGAEKRIFKMKRVAKLTPLERNPNKKKPVQIHKMGKVDLGMKTKRNVGGVNLAGDLGKDIFIIRRPGLNNLRKPQFSEGSSKLLASKVSLKKKEAYHSHLSNHKRPALKLKKSEKTPSTSKPVTLDEIEEEDIDQSEIERRMDSLIKEWDSSFKCSDKNQPRTRETVDKSITMGKVEAAVKAVDTALEKLDEGCSVEDAMNICGPEVLDEIARWKHKLQLYLGPFLHGARYTSYGRHFTKVEKLHEIVDKLHLYAQDGDTIVDFSCGSNDFSCLMSKKLESVGKKCFFKNYDLFQAKNDFNFEKRDWFTIRKEELPLGSRLIIGLNPPFGVKAKLANQFIDKALQFKPKLVILIVPTETQRLDKKRCPYNLIWEDVNLLAGKSFYLPGSVDVHNKQLEQWNMVSPPLSLWSRPDWTQKHREIAMACNHVQSVRQPAISNYLMEDRHDCYGDFSSLSNQTTDLLSLLDDVPEDGGGVYEHQNGSHAFGEQALVS